LFGVIADVSLASYAGKKAMNGQAIQIGGAEVQS
jgi:hypothetical protein